MAAVSTNSARNSTEAHVQIPMDRAKSGRFRRPILDFVDDPKGLRKCMEICLPIEKAAMNGKFKDVSHLFDKYPELVETAITKNWATALHVAAGTNNVHFVEELMKIMGEELLTLQDCKDNTAFFFAAANGNKQMAEIMLRKNKSLPTIRGNQSVTPLHLAVIQGRSEMARFLYPLTSLEEKDFNELFLSCVYLGIYDLALKMLTYRPMLAGARDEKQNTALHFLAQKRPVDSCSQTQYLKLVKTLWKEILNNEEEESKIKEIINTPSSLIFIAAKDGNFEFLAELMSSYPSLIWEVDNNNQSIIHFAVLRRHANIFNIIHEIGSYNDLIVTLEDSDKNNLLHCAAKLAPSDQLNRVSGATFQLMLELLWFEEVRKVVPPSLREKKNSKNLTPRELFTKQHKNLLGKAERWMKDTANYCMIVSTVIATGVFSALFSVPGGNDDDNGIPHYLKKLALKIFVISDGIALISSSTSTLIFLSILISRYAEDDFRKSLPQKLISGLLMLFISITSMMVAFSSAAFITYYHGVKWVPSLISILAFLPILLFVILQFRLWYDIYYSAYYCRSLFRPQKRIIG